jgi:hypothetical protein
VDPQGIFICERIFNLLSTTRNTSGYEIKRDVYILLEWESKEIEDQVNQYQKKVVRNWKRLAFAVLTKELLTKKCNLWFYQ